MQRLVILLLYTQSHVPAVLSLSLCLSLHYLTSSRIPNLNLNFLKWYDVQIRHIKDVTKNMLKLSYLLATLGKYRGQITNFKYFFKSSKNFV